MTMTEGSAGKQGLPITRDPGRVLRPGDAGFPEASGHSGARSPLKVCRACLREYRPTSNAQRRCPTCAVKQGRPANRIHAVTTEAPSPATETAARNKRASQPLNEPGVGRRPARRSVPAPMPTEGGAGPDASRSLAVDVPLTATVMVKLLRAAADRLEELERGGESP